jgi:AcrR family transcriptional regulator
LTGFAEQRSIARMMTEHTRARGGQRYHHGDLRQALIDASRKLLAEHGPEGFSLSDACRMAGVTTAAPYKHFRDKLEILSAVAEQGFTDLATRLRHAAQTKPEESLGRIAAMGIAYLSFALEETAVFRLMFGQNKALKRREAVAAEGRGAFETLVSETKLYLARRDGGEPLSRALELWTFVHGAASLAIDDDYAKVAPALDAKLMIESAVERLMTAPSEIPPSSASPRSPRSCSDGGKRRGMRAQRRS